jgi:hypothetical protein
LGDALPIHNPWLGPDQVAAWLGAEMILRASVEKGKDRWVTAYPDLHTGIDGLSAIRGPENLLMDMLENPDPVRRAMSDMTELFKKVVDVVSDVLRASGQGTTNWTAGWSSGGSWRVSMRRRR